MTTRAMGPMAGLGWLMRAINVGRNGPGAVFGGAALMTLAILALSFGAGLIQVGLAAMVGDSMFVMLASTVLVGVLVLVLMAMMMVGFLRVLDKVERGRPASALQVFNGFADLPTSLRTIVLMVLLAIVQNVILGLILVTFAGGFVDWYLQILQVSMMGGDPTAMAQLPAGMGFASVAMLVVGLMFYAVQAISLGQVILRGRGVTAALGDGVVGAFKNLLPLLVFVIACLVAMVLVGIAMFVVVMVLGLLAKFVGTWLAVLLAIPLYIGGMLAMFVVMFGAMYHLWRDVCGGDDAGQDPVATRTAIA